jgi:hypothetical protein
MSQLSDLESEQNFRRAIQQERAAEIQRQTIEHQAEVLRYNKFRRAKRLVGPEPVNIHAIGDSWFEYPLDGNVPVPFSNFAIVADSQLKAKGSPSPKILNRAKHGQTTTDVMSWQSQTTMIYDWMNPKNWTSGRVDAISRFHGRKRYCRGRPGDLLDVWWRHPLNKQALQGRAGIGACIL